MTATVTFTRYTYDNPALLPVERDEDGSWIEAGVADWDATMTAAGFDPTDDRVGIGFLIEDWNGHRPGSLVVSAATVTGHPFAVSDDPDADGYGWQDSGR